MSSWLTLITSGNSPQWPWQNLLLQWLNHSLLAFNSGSNPSSPFPLKNVLIDRHPEHTFSEGRDNGEKGKLGAWSPATPSTSHLTNYTSQSIPISPPPPPPFLGPHLQHMEVPKLGIKSNWSYSCQLTPQLQPRRIWAISVTHTTAHGNTGSLTHWMRPGIEPAPGSLTTEPWWELPQEAYYSLLPLPLITNKQNSWWQFQCAFFP